MACEMYAVNEISGGHTEMASKMGWSSHITSPNLGAASNKIRRPKETEIREATSVNFIEADLQVSPSGLSRPFTVKSRKELVKSKHHLKVKINCSELCCSPSLRHSFLRLECFYMEICTSNTYILHILGTITWDHTRSGLKWAIVLYPYLFTFQISSVSTSHCKNYYSPPQRVKGEPHFSPIDHIGLCKRVLLLIFEAKIPLPTSTNTRKKIG